MDIEYDFVYIDEAHHIYKPGVLKVNDDESEIMSVTETTKYI